MFLTRFRPHLFEFGDQPWFPRVLRDAETAYLAVAYRLLPLARLWAEKIAAVLPVSEPVEILDLCSGSGGPMLKIVEELRNRGYEVSATLSDLYPNPESVSQAGISWHAEPLDAAHVPAGMSGLRTMFTAFHHFRPAAAREILKDAFEQGRTICIFEGGSGTMFGFVQMLMVPLYVIVLMPFARPLRLGYLAFTYLIPLMPLVLLWDGVVSSLRIYSPERMREMTRGLEGPGYRWEVGRMAVFGLPYLIGRPVAS